MAYIGNVPADKYSTLSKQTITGDGTTGPYTLDYAVATAQDIEVFVNNVRQEPGVAYTVAGTALTMTGAVSSSDDFYVVFQGKAVQTTTHPSGQNLQALDAQLTGDLKLETSSGGIYTVTGTDTATNRTLTLPNEAGTVLTSASVLESLSIQGTLSDDTQTTPETLLTIGASYNSTGANGGAGAGARIELQVPDDETNPTTGAAIGSIKTSADDSDSSSGLAFYTSNNDTTLDEAMRIDSSGDLIVGGTSSGDLSGVDAQLTVRGGTENTGIAFQSGGANTDHWEAYANQSARFYIENNNTSNGAYLTYNSGSGWSSVSDARWKANWTALENSSSKISALNIGKYNMLNNAKEIVEGAKWDYGVKAQELVEVIPDAVDVPENLDDKYGVVPNIVFWHGVKALQEALAKIETLETTVADLQTRVTALETN